MGSTGVNLSRNKDARWVPEIGKVVVSREGKDVLYLTKDEYDQIGELFEKGSDTDKPMDTIDRSV